MKQLFNLKYDLKRPEGLKGYYQTLGFDWGNLWKGIASGANGVLTAFGYGDVAQGAIGLVDGIITAAGGQPSGVLTPTITPELTAAGQTVTNSTINSIQSLQAQGINPSQSLVQGEYIYNLVKQALKMSGLSELTADQESRLDALINMFVQNYPTATAESVISQVTDIATSTFRPEQLMQKLQEESIIIPKSALSVGANLSGCQAQDNYLKGFLGAYDPQDVSAYVIIEGTVKEGINPNIQEIEYMNRQKEVLNNKYELFATNERLLNDQFRKVMAMVGANEAPTITILQQLFPNVNVEELWEEAYSGTTTTDSGTTTTDTDDEVVVPVVVPTTQPSIVVNPQISDQVAFESENEKFEEFLNLLLAQWNQYAAYAQGKLSGLNPTDRDDRVAYNYYKDLFDGYRKAIVYTQRKLDEIQAKTTDVMRQDYWIPQQNWINTWKQNNNNLILADQARKDADCAPDYDEECVRFFDNLINGWKAIAGGLVNGEKLIKVLAL